MLSARRLAPLALACLFAAPAVMAQDRPTYGPRLEGFDYPFPVRTHTFTSQRQPLEMAFMDVAPIGKANGRTVVLLHGKNFCGATWEETIRTLSAAGFRVIAPDQVGFCKSSKPAAYQFSFSQLADNTHGLLKTFGVEKAVIVGHSLGGMLATRYALNHPAAVEQLVLVNPIGLEDWQAEGVPYATIDAAYQGELKTSFESIKAYQQKVYYDGDWKPGYDRWVAMLAGMYAGAGKEVVAWNQAQTSDMLFTQPVVHELAKVAVPTTLLIGQKDRTAPGGNRAAPEIAQRLGHYPTLGRKAAAAIPGATLVEFETLGHSPQVEDPAVFHAALLKALGA